MHGASDATAAPASQGRAIIVAGPTASGKSALAIDLARRWGGVVINADAMQVYRELRVITARPSAADAAAVPHFLYGVRAAADGGSVAWWRAAALQAMADAQARGAVPILCGGTGMYFSALTQGLSEIPEAGEKARTEARALLAEHGAAWLHAQLAEADPDSAGRLRPSDGQRVARAWEVWRGTGLGIAGRHARARATPAWRFAAIRLDPDRAALRQAIARRFAAMVEHGALAEVAALLELGLDPALPALPALRALGVRELGGYLAGTLTLEQAIERAVVASAQYSKRQTTWLRHHELADPSVTHIIHAQYTSFTQLSERIIANFSNFLDNTVDGG